MTRVARHVPERLLEEYWFGRTSAEEATAIEEHLSHCPDCLERWRKTQDEIQFLQEMLRAAECPFLERRNEERLPVSGRIRLRILRDSGRAIAVAAELRDESRSGVGLFSRKPLHAGYSVQLQKGRLTLRGVVRYCRPEYGGYKIGIELSAA